jgi:hypothetical protein
MTACRLKQHQTDYALQDAGMSHVASPMRSARARKTVKTYNLKILSGKPTRRASRRSLNGDDHNSTSNEVHATMSSIGKNDDSKAATPDSGLVRNSSNDSSELTTPMRSPGLAVLQTFSASGDIEQTYLNKSKSLYDCFNQQLHPKGHFYSANQLYARGIWVGYLSPDRMNEPFRRLPSLSDLKVNYSNFSPPHPPVVKGSARENRNAVCRGCVTASSAVIALSEVQFVGKTVSPPIPTIYTFFQEIVNMVD